MPPARHPSPRRRLAALAAISIAILLVPSTQAQAQAPAPAPEFTDVSGTHAAAVRAIAAAGITDGCRENEYCPFAPVTRAQMASFLKRALDLPDGPVDAFGDVDGVHARAIGALKEAGITQGCADGRYCPGDHVTRQQMATFLTRALSIPSTSTRYFFDVSGTHGPAAQALGAAGVSAGCDGLGLSFCPIQPVRRDEMASFLGRALDLVGRTPIPLTLRPGDTGPAVTALQQRLASYGYWVGPADGTYGTLTQHAVMAVQKVHELGRDGIYGPDTRAAVAAPTTPATRSTAGYVAEFDMNRQIVMLVRNGHPETILHASGGDESYYTYEGVRYWAETPVGSWRIYRQIDGWRTSNLGRLWRPKYFHSDGIAFHGYQSVPAYAASHGCIRLSMSAMDWVWETNALPIGTEVLVYGSPG